MENNPLTAYFRRPEIYIKLPSGGDYYPNGTLTKTDTGEYPVFPMTAVDEITYRTPDALFNGQATVDVIQSCIPNIKNAWVIPSNDIDTILVAIRIASYGKDVDIDTKCPVCAEESNYTLDLNTVLDNIKTSDYKTPLIIGDLTIFLKPLSYKQITENNLIRFEEQKLMAVLTDAEMPEEEKTQRIRTAFKNLSTLTLKAVTQGILYIKTPETTVSQPQFIGDFLKNCDSKAFDKIRDRVLELKINSEIKPLDIECQNCHHKYKQEFTLDVTSFFGQN